MRIVLDLVAVLNAGAVIGGFMWRWRRRSRRRLSHPEYIEQKQREIDELDAIQERIEGPDSGKLRP